MNFEQILHIVLVFQLLTLNKQIPGGWWHKSFMDMILWHNGYNKLIIGECRVSE